DGQEEITADELADLLGTINYEVVTRIPECVERKFV
ncbi:MAG: alanine racemase C-terminal domain-containing protein, partial [Candidatus Berkelbacteria bacterium]